MIKGTFLRLRLKVGENDLEQICKNNFFTCVLDFTRQLMLGSS